MCQLYLNSHPVGMSVHSHPSEGALGGPWGTAWSQWCSLGALESVNISLGALQSVRGSLGALESVSSPWQGPGAECSHLCLCGCELEHAGFPKLCSIPWPFLGWEQRCFMCAGADMGQGRGSQKESSCSSCCPAQLHPLCSASRPWSWVGFACCCSPRACEEQAAVLLVLAFPASHLLLAPGAVGMAAERVICEHWRLLQCFNTVPYCLCFAATTACKCK